MQKYFEKLYRDNSTEFYKVVCKDLQNSQKAFIITANPETFMMGQENKNFGKVLESKNTIIIDVYKRQINISVFLHIATIENMVAHRRPHF